MKIVIATPLYPPEIGGPATYVKILEENLPKHGILVQVVKFSDVRHVPKFVRHYRYFKLVYAAARSADIVLALDPVSVGLPASWAARLLRKPFLVKIVGDYAWEQARQRFGTTQGLDAFVEAPRGSFPVWVLRRIQTSVSRRASRVIVPSEYLKKIVTAWGIPEHKIQVIYNTVSLEGLGTVPEAVTALQRPLVVTAGRLVPWKHIEGVIDAVATHPEMSLVIIGDGPEWETLHRYGNEKLGNRVFFTGKLSHQDTLATIKTAGVFVLNSSYEGFSHLLIEALMLGVPIVATDVGGNREVIQDGSSGILVPGGDTDALGRALKQAKRPLAGSVSPFTKERMLDATITLLKSL